MPQGHETFYGQTTSPELAELEAAKQSTWASYSGLQPAPGWEGSSIDQAAAAARAQYALDKAKGLR
ncbi:MAG: hypothetical protein QOJ46_59 [bacterium]|jgi:hypothetical protein